MRIFFLYFLFLENKRLVDFLLTQLSHNFPNKSKALNGNSVVFLRVGLVVTCLSNGQQKLSLSKIYRQRNTGERSEAPERSVVLIDIQRTCESNSAPKTHKPNKNFPSLSRENLIQLGARCISASDCRGGAEQSERNPKAAATVIGSSMWSKSLPYSKKDVYYDNAKFRHRSLVKVLHFLDLSLSFLRF